MEYRNSSFGNLVATIRRNKKLTGRRLAELLDVGPTRISAIENSRVPPPSPETVQKIGKALGCNFVELRALVFAAECEAMATPIDRLFPGPSQRALAKTSLQAAELLGEHGSYVVNERMDSLMSALTFLPPSLRHKEAQSM